MSRPSVQVDREDESLKAQVKEHWERESCGARNGIGQLDRKAFFDQIERVRYQQDYMIKDFADFTSAKDKKVLEVGLGTGSDFMQWCRAGAVVYGRDLTEAAVQYVKERLDLEQFTADVATGDAEALDFPDNSFDVYYSWGVLHHTPDPQKAFSEAYRVLKPGGILKIMLYHHPSVATMLVWMVYGPFRLNFKGPRNCVYHHVESIGTKVFSKRDALRDLGKLFPPDSIRMRTFLGAGDLLTHTPSEKYHGAIWKFLMKVYPRWLVRGILGPRFGSILTISAIKR